MGDDLNNVRFQPELGDEPPAVSIGIIINSFKTRGFMNTINDEGIGPHVHLFVLLSIVLMLAVIIGLIQLAS